eukprot:2663404-Prymnesium_polylepis.1
MGGCRRGRRSDVAQKAARSLLEDLGRTSAARLSAAGDPARSWQRNASGRQSATQKLRSSTV